MGTLTNPLVGRAAEGARAYSDRLRERAAIQQMGRFSLDPGAMAGVLPEEEVQAAKDIAQKPIGFAMEQAHEALAPAASDFLRTSGIDPSSSPEHVLNLPRVTPEFARTAGENLTLTHPIAGTLMKTFPGVAAGLFNLGSSTTEGLAQPEQAGLMVASGGSSAIAKAAGLLFAGAQFADLPDEIKEAIRVLKDPNASNADRVEAIGKPGVNAILGATMLKHGLTPDAPPGPPLTPQDRWLMERVAQNGGLTGRDLQMPGRIPATMRGPLTPGLEVPEMPAHSRLEIPEGPSDPRVAQIRQQGLREINQILAAFPDTLKGNREDARALRNDAFPEMRKDKNAVSQRSTTPVPVQEPSGDSQTVEQGIRPGEEPPVQGEAQVPTQGDEAFFQQQLGEIQGRQAAQINAEIVKTVQEKGWAALDESDRRYMTPEQRKAYKAWVDAGKPEGGGKVKPEEPPPTEEAPPTEPTPPTTPTTPTAPAAPITEAPTTPASPLSPTTQDLITRHQDENASLNNSHSQAAGLGAKGIPDLDAFLELKRKAQKRLAELKEQAKDPKLTPEQKLKLQMEGGFKWQPRLSIPREAIETATKSGSWEKAVPELNLPEERPLDWRKNPEVAKWLVENGKEVGLSDDAIEEIKKSLPKAEAATPETKPAATETKPAEIESLLKAEVPDVTEHKARVKAVETRTRELGKEIDVTSGQGSNPYRATGGAEKPPSSIKTFKDWQEAKDYHGLTATDRIHDWSPALRAVAEKVNPEKPELVTAGDVDEWVKRKEEGKPAAAAASGGVAEFVVSKLEDAADKARARLRAQEQKGIGGETFIGGMFTKIPNAIDYATIGAAKLARFGLDKARFAAEMIAEFGKRISPHLDTLFEDAKGLLARHYEIEKNKATPIQQIISEATGAGHGQLDTIGKIIDTLQSGLKTVRALRDHFTDKPHISRAEAKLADDFLEADANRIRESLNALVKKELPPSQRGIFLTAISNATKRAPLLTGDPEAMYRRAAEVAARIEEHGVNVQRNQAVNDIKANVTKALASPTVDLAFKAKIGDVVKNFNFTKPTENTIAKLQKIRDYIKSQEALGRDVEMPKAILDALEILNKTPIKDLPLHVLEAMRDRIAMLEQMGRRTVATRQLRWENEKAVKNRELTDEPTNPIDKRPEFSSGLTDPISPTMKIRNFINRRLDAGGLLDKALLPIDALFDLLGDAKGAYKGWLFKHVRNPIDLGFNATQVMREQITKPLVDIIKKNGLNETNAKRIGVYAALQQEGGRERLLAMGATPAELDKIQSGLTPVEKSAYNYMRSALDELLPQVQKMMHELYNIPVEPVENYFPMPRDWNKVEPEPKTPAEPKFGQEMAFDDLAGWKDLYGDYTPLKTKTERGFTIERKPGAESAIKIHAFDVFEQHINDVAYLLKTQRDIKMIGELAKGDLFLEKYGKIGQSMVLNWLDTVARQGRLGGLRRWDALDTLRKNTSAGVIGFRLASQFVHLSNIPLAMERTGVLNYTSAVHEIWTEKGKKFLADNFAETFSRGGGEPALTEAMQEGASVFGKQIVPKKYVKAGFYFARLIDQKNSQATVLGMYFKALKEKGLDPARYADMPVDKEAQARALVMARRAVASPLPKDVPMVLSRGSMVGNNVSIGRALFQFQNIFLDQWSNIRHDFARAGIREVNPVKAARIGAALAVMIGLETGIREASKEVIKGLTGYHPKKKEPPIEAKVLVETARRFPIMGQLTAAMMYGETGVPLIDSLLQVPREAYRAVTAKKPKAQDKAAIRAIAGAAQVSGVPGASQIGELIEKSQ